MDWNHIIFSNKFRFCLGFDDSQQGFPGMSPPDFNTSLVSVVTKFIANQVCRGLMISAVCLGFFGAILALVGMKCTKIGGSETTKARMTCLSGLHFILSGICSLTTCSLYAHRITSEFFDPLFVAQKEYSYNGATSFISTRNKKSHESLHKDGANQSSSARQFGRNAYV
ncbi:hypothetical protein NFI96_000802 [Prochilodus magdalenae]|nr:hypothetical protein NFI96_000802 [Prochilodus magdalenae]